MRNKLLRLLVFAGATVSVFAQEPGLSARTEESARATTVLSSFGLNPATPVTRRPYRDPFPAFPQICTNAEAEVFLQCRIAGWPGWPQVSTDSYPLKIRVFVREPSGPAIGVGNAYLFASETNSLSTVFSPVMDTTMSDESIIRRWNPVPMTNGFVFIGYPGVGQTNGIPDHIYRIKDGAACFLRSKTVTNLLEWADFICDTLVERFCVEPEEE